MSGLPISSRAGRSMPSREEPTTEPRTVAAELAQQLADAGVRHAFGFPGGGSNLELIDALGEAGIEFVLNHTEVAAAFMAIATSEVAGRPAVAIVGNGPGLSSVVNGAAEAHLDRNPLIILSDRYADSELGTTDHQVLDQRAILEPVVRWAATLEPEGAEETIRRALEVAMTPPLGPVHLDMPRDVGSRTVEPAPSPDESAEPPSPAPASTDQDALAAVREARRPMVALGLEAVTNADPAVLLELVEHLDAPFLTTYKAKGAIDERHPLAVGVLTGGVVEADAIAQADLMLAIGLDPVELLTKPYSYGTPVVSVRTCSLLDDYFSPIARHTGDIDVFLQAALQEPGGSEWEADAARGFRTEYLNKLRIESEAGLAGWQVVTTVLDEAPDEASVAGDAGANMLPVTNFWQAAVPRRFLISSGLASMGFAIPAAVGAAITNPDVVSFAFTGDGGAQYHLSELETAVRADAKVIVVVLNDASLSLIRIKQEAKGLTPRGMNFGPVDFSLAAEAYGAHGEVAVTEEDLRGAVRRALARDGSTVIDVRMAGDEYPATLSAIRG